MTDAALLTACEAMWALADEADRAAWAAADRLVPSDADPLPMIGARLGIEASLHRRLHAALSAGAMLAQGWPDDGGPRCMIPPPAWAGLGLDVARARAEGGGRAWAGLRFWPAPAPAAPTAPPSAPSGAA
ncbi:hypothetical protein, partial [Neoroseomonas rubea]|uniref:hypothetical protein n=1 Tax=Neoroseomonas rubea TaxID=2748666 RepID=UPI0018E024E0